MTTSSNFVKSLIGDQSKKVEILEPYLKKNEDWRFSVARVMLTGVLKNQYYRSADNAAKEALPLMITAAKKDPEFLLKATAFARDANMKGMVKLAIAALAARAPAHFLNQNRDTIIGLLATFHPGQLIQFVELMKSKALGRGFGARSQKWVQEVMQSWRPEKVEEFTLKYPSAYKILLRLVHPSYSDVRSGLVRYILDASPEYPKYGKPSGKKQKAVERIKDPSTSDVAIAKAMLKYEIPWDVVKGFHPVKGDVGLAMLTQMGLSALLLNTRSLEQNGVLDDPNGIKAFELKLNEVKHGRSIPIDFAKPYIYSTNSHIKELLVKAIVDTLGKEMPHIEGRSVGVSVDISGSMRGEPLMTAGLLAVPFLKARNLWFTTFDTECYEEGVKSSGRTLWGGSPEGSYICPLLKGQEPVQQVQNLLSLRTNGGTNVAVSLNKALQNNIKLDLHVLITDEQQNTGTPLMSVWREYKRRINPRAELWVINATNYEWHSADFDDTSITVYQTMTPVIFHNLQFFGQDLVASIEAYNLNKVRKLSQFKPD